MSKISIVIPTRNRNHLIERLISNSLIHKNIDFEVIVSDNSSEDNTWAKLKKFKKKYTQIKIIKHNHLLDLAEHWDIVISLYANGKYILVLPDDDIITDEYYLSDACNILDKNKDISVVFSRYKKINVKGDIVGKYETKWPVVTRGSEMLKKYNSGHDIFVPHLTAIFRKNDYERVKGFKSTALSPDMFLWLKLTAIGNFAFIDRYVAKYMIHETNYSNNLDPFLQIRDVKMLELVEKYFKAINKFGPEEKKHLKRIKRFILRKFYSVIFKNIYYKKRFKLIWLKNVNVYYFFWDYVIKGIKVKLFKIGSI